MLFYSTKQQSPNIGLAAAVMRGLAPDGGLYMPRAIPKLPQAFLARMNLMSFQEIALEVGKEFFLPDVPRDVFSSIVVEAFNFPVPIIELDKNVHVMELFHGPTLAFKDFAARFMARLIAYFAKQSQKEVTILVATSGDTGSAVAHGFLDVPGINVIILYPSGKVSNIQEKQLTTMGKNITALEVKGTFDDCQKLVKEAFLDNAVQQKRSLASANSINIARLLPQSFYYVYLSAQLQKKELPIVVSVPSGNFGNLTAGLIAKRMGAPISKFIAATNRNDVVPHYLETGNFEPKASFSTISNAMDVGNPSNFVRMLELYDHDATKMKQDVFGVSFSDQETRGAMLEVYKKYNYIMDPHGAVAYLGLRHYQKNYPNRMGVFIETAHPAKFGDIVTEAIHAKVPMPERLGGYLKRKKKAVLIENNFTDLKEFLLK